MSFEIEYLQEQKDKLKQPRDYTLVYVFIITSAFVAVISGIIYIFNNY